MKICHWLPRWVVRSRATKTANADKTAAIDHGVPMSAASSLVCDLERGWMQSKQSIICLKKALAAPLFRHRDGGALASRDWRLPRSGQP